MHRPALFFVVLALSTRFCVSFNGELSELECPDDCDCHYFRINWVTDCSSSNLTEIPYDELSLNVYILDLNGNHIFELRPFPQDIKLRRLQMSENLMTELKKDSFAALNYLIDADFSWNKIQKVDSEIISELAGFITFELQGNPLEPVEGPFLSSKSLLELDIAECGLKNLNPQFFSNLTSLSKLDLSGNPLGTLENRVLDPLTSLGTLILNDCNLTYIAEYAFLAQDRLTCLEMRGNNFIRTEWSSVLDYLPRLETLDLTRSGIKYLPETVFSNNTYLRDLFLAKNDLRNLDVSRTLGKLQHLELLDLSQCHLTLPLSEDAFANATKLRTLYLSGNSLFASDLLVALAPLSNLQKLSLSDCGLTRLPDTFHNLLSLQSLDISYNPLNDAFVKLLKPLDKLEHLNMGYSNLSYLAPNSFSKMTNMKTLFLSGNDLNNLEAGLFGNLTKLKTLSLNFCRLRRPINATQFFNNLTYTDLTELQLAGNPLQVPHSGSLLPRQLSRLEHLDLSDCNLSFLPKEAFFWTRNITTLILRGNHFSSSESLQFLEFIPKLKVLDLTYNNLTSLSPKTFASEHLEKVRLLGNPWKCDCSIAHLWDWAHLEKGSIAVLEASTLREEQTAPGKAKKRNLLSCSYDTRLPLPVISNKTVPGRRPFVKPPRALTSSTRTWAKYVRESGCEQMPVLHRAPRAAAQRLEGNEWAGAALAAGALYVAVMGAVGVAMVGVRRRVRRTPAGKAN